MALIRKTTTVEEYSEDEPSVVNVTNVSPSGHPAPYYGEGTYVIGRCRTCKHWKLHRNENPALKPIGCCEPLTTFLFPTGFYHEKAVLVETSEDFGCIKFQPQK